MDDISINNSNNIVLRQGSENPASIHDNFHIIGYCQDPQQSDLINLYNVSPLAKTVCFRYAEKVFGDGIEFYSSDEIEEPEAASWLENSNANRVFVEAYAWSRVIGISLVVMSFDDETGMAGPLRRTANSSKIVFKVIYTNYRKSDDGRFIELTENGELIRISFERTLVFNSTISGKPLLYSIYNHILKIECASAASSSAFIANQRADVVMGIKPSETQPLDSALIKSLVDKVKAALRKAKERMVVAGIGLTPQVITYPTQDPLNNNKALYQVISGYVKIPLRILISESTGVVKGSEDVASYNSTILDDQNTFGKQVLNQLKERLVSLALMPDYVDLKLSLQQPATEESLANMDNTLADTQSKRANTVQSLVLAGVNINVEHYMKTGEIQDVTNTNS